MNYHNVKILFLEIPENIESVLKNHFDNNTHSISFCCLPESESAIKSFEPDILITYFSEKYPFSEDRIKSIKSLSTLSKIPLAVLIQSSSEYHYTFLLDNDIHRIITLPLSRNAITAEIKKFIGINNPPFDKSGPNKRCNEVNKILLSNLINQNRALKKHLKKESFHNEFKKIHYERVEDLRSMEKRLWEALEMGYFRLYYQPVISLETGRIAGFESLIRLIHPVEGIIPPDKFISLAEKSAIIFPLGLWIVEEACRQKAAWKERFGPDIYLKININLSAKQFIHPDLAEHIFEITEKYSIDENDVAFEVTESAFMEDMESANLALLKLRSKKFSIYMDDFGTGYSSLSYLMHFPVNVIKIDQSFVKWMHIDEQSEIIVKSVIMLAHNLGLKVVAEGTEEVSQIEMLKLYGCDYAQGYYYAKPLPEKEAEEYIKVNLAV